MFVKVSKREAFERFSRGEAITLCPHKLRPGYPFSPHYTLFPDSINEYKSRAMDYSEHKTLWKGSEDKTAWSLMYNNWSYYNTGYEQGYYAAYYVEG